MHNQIWLQLTTGSVWGVGFTLYFKQHTLLKNLVRKKFVRNNLYSKKVYIKQTIKISNNPLFIT